MSNVWNKDHNFYLSFEGTEHIMFRKYLTFSEVCEVKCLYLSCTCFFSMWKMVENVIRHCKPDGLASVATIACEFMEEFSLMTIVKQSSSSHCTSDELFQDKIHIPGALFLSIQFDSRWLTSFFSIFSSIIFALIVQHITEHCWLPEWTDCCLPFAVVLFLLILRMNAYVFVILIWELLF